MDATHCVGQSTAPLGGIGVCGVSSGTLQYSTGTHMVSRTPRVPEQRSALARASGRTAAAVRSDCGTRAARVRACAAPTPIPTSTPAPTNVGDTNPPTRGPNFADPTGNCNARDSTPPFPFPLLPPQAAHCIIVLGFPGRVAVLHALVAHGTTAAVPRGYCRVPRRCHTVRYC
jgi:hypothetical protein